MNVSDSLNSNALLFGQNDVKIFIKIGLQNLRSEKNQYQSWNWNTASGPGVQIK